uniref:Peptidase S1 domain-containing protein n=2 Tax=Tetranychus urticae TaxID=32264 RepID=T1JYB4_TETUR
METSLSDCYESDWNSINTRVYGGTHAKDAEYPWIAHLRFFIGKNTTRYGLCGGSLIDEWHIITAAHCIHDSSKKLRPIESVEVYLGVKDLTALNKPYKVSKYFYPHNYNQETLYNDIAILRLTKPVVFTEKVSPVCLANSMGKPFLTLTVAGYGRLGPNRKPATSLMKVDVEYIDKESCNKMLRDFIIRMNPDIESRAKKFEMPKVHGSHMCAVDTFSGADACSGDSGGPLMYKDHKDGRYYVVGIVSGAMDECGDPRTPGFYTTVAKFRPFIEKVAPGTTFCQV